MSFGILELLLILGLVVLMFGTGKLTRAMGDLAKGVKAFRGGMKDEPEAPPPPPVLPRALAPPPDAGNDGAGKART